MERNDFNLAKALQIRMTTAVEAAGGRDAVLAPIVDSVFEIVKDADVPAMRALGGYSAVIAKVLGDSAETQANQLGIATNQAYWVWRFRKNNTDWIREQVQIRRQEQQ